MFAGRVLLVAVLCSGAIAATAQVGIEKGPAPRSEIRLNVQVTYSGGQPTGGLTQQDLSILDNHTAANIVSVREATPSTEPVHAIILLDAVNVRYTELAYERDQVLRFLRSNGGKLAVPTSVAVLTDKGVQLQKGFSQDGNALAAGFDEHEIGLRTITRSSGFWGASERFEIAANALQSLSRFAGTLPGRKFLLWVSPGWPLLSGPEVQLDSKAQKQIFGSIMQISNELRNANLTLYAINPLGAIEDVARTTYYKTFLKGVTKPSDAQLGNLALQVLAEQSGGLALQGSTDVAAGMSRCLQDAASWYEVRLTPPEAEDGKPYHRIELKVSKPGLEVRTRQGYYVDQ